VYGLVEVRVRVGWISSIDPVGERLLLVVSSSFSSSGVGVSIFSLVEEVTVLLASGVEELLFLVCFSLSSLARRASYDY
jgi:hypothetical protein